MDGPYEHRYKKRWSTVLHGWWYIADPIYLDKEEEEAGVVYTYNFNGLASLWMMIEVIAGLDSSRRDIRR